MFVWTPRFVVFVHRQASRAAWAALETAHAILIPGGFGGRGVEGKIAAAAYARKSNKPFLGICLGMQVAVIEFARNALGIAGANSEEFDDSLSPRQRAVIFMPEGSREAMGGTMRLGARRSILKPGTLAHWLYGNKQTRAPRGSRRTDSRKTRFLRSGRDSVWERHRHRYEVNPPLGAELEAAGLVIAGRDELGTRAEVVELPSHPFFLGVQVSDSLSLQLHCVAEHHSFVCCVAVAVPPRIPILAWLAFPVLSRLLGRCKTTPAIKPRSVVRNSPRNQMLLRKTSTRHLKPANEKILSAPPADVSR